VRLAVDRQHAGRVDHGRAVVVAAVLAEFGETDDRDRAAPDGLRPAGGVRSGGGDRAGAQLLGGVEDVAAGGEFGEHQDVGTGGGLLLDRARDHVLIARQIADAGSQLAADDAGHRILSRLLGRRRLRRR